MSKLSFRARQVDVNKKLSIFSEEEIPDLPDYASTNRTIPRMPTGMEKEEEMEHHLQKAISARKSVRIEEEGGNEAVIPIPKVSYTDADHFDRLYPPDYQLPKQLIKVQADLGLNPDLPDYDLDSEDESWLRCNGVEALQFERIMDILEKQSEFKVVQASEINKLLPQEEESVILLVYDHWLTKRCETQGRQLIPRVKTEKRETQASNANNPYVAFRRRAEKMQTRKNRRNDEESYEKILKLRAELERAVTLTELVKKREETKRQVINLGFDIIEKRFRANDFRGQISTASSTLPQAGFARLVEKIEACVSFDPRTVLVAEKRKQQLDDLVPIPTSSQTRQIVSGEKTTSATSNPVRTTEASTAKSLDKPADECGRYAFVRKRGCRYYAPVDVETDEEEEESEYDSYHPAKLNSRRPDSLKFAGLVRRRVGRGGRVLLDRIPWRSCKYSSLEVPSNSLEQMEDDSATYRPVCVPEESDSDDGQSGSLDDSMATLQGPRGSLNTSVFVGSLDGADAPMTEAVETVEQSMEFMLSVGHQLDPLDGKESSPGGEHWKNVNLDDSGSTIEIDLDSSLDDQARQSAELSTATVNPNSSPPSPPPYNHHHTVTTPLLRPDYLSLNQLNSTNSSPFNLMSRKKKEEVVKPHLLLSHKSHSGSSPGQAFLLPPGLVRISPKVINSNRGRGKSTIRMNRTKGSKVMMVGARVGAPALAASPVVTPPSDHGTYSSDCNKGPPIGHNLAKAMVQTNLGQQQKSERRGETLIGNSASNALMQLGYPLPTPSPSPGPADAVDSAWKWEDYFSKAVPIVLNRTPLGHTHPTGIN